MIDILCLTCKNYGYPVTNSYNTPSGYIKHVTFIHCLHGKIEGDIIPRIECPHYEVKKDDA